LRTLKDYAKTLKRQGGEKIESFSKTDIDPVVEYIEKYVNAIEFETFLELLERADTMLQLSGDAKNVLDYLLSWSWDNPEKAVRRLPRKIPTTRQFMINFGWGQSRVLSAWNELKNWWVLDKVPNFSGVCSYNK
jgi:hypothetical protein